MDSCVEQVVQDAATQLRRRPLGAAAGLDEPQERLLDVELFAAGRAGGEVLAHAPLVVRGHLAVEELVEVVQRFLRASLRGWKYAIENQPEAVEITLKQSPNLKKDHQTIMLREVAKLMTWGPSKEKGLGYLDPKAAEFTMSFLLENKQLSKAVPIGEAVNARFWTEVPVSMKVVR